MFNALKVAAVVAVVTVGGFAALRVGLPPGPGTGAPGAETPNVAEDWAFFTGTVDRAAAEALLALSEPFTQNGLSVDLGGWGKTGRSIVTDDPRMTGMQTMRVNRFTDTSGGGDISAVLKTIENDAGSAN